MRTTNASHLRQAAFPQRKLSFAHSSFHILLQRSFPHDRWQLFRFRHQIVPHLIQGVVVRLFRRIPTSPIVPFQLLNQLGAIRKDIQIRQSVVLFQITFHPCNSRKKVFFDVGVHQNPTFVKQFANVLDAGQSPLLRSAVNQSSNSPRRIGFPPEQRANAFNLRRVIIDVTTCGKMPWAGNRSGIFFGSKARNYATKVIADRFVQSACFSHFLSFFFSTISVIFSSPLKWNVASFPSIITFSTIERNISRLNSSSSFSLDMSSFSLATLSMLCS